MRPFRHLIRVMWDKKTKIQKDKKAKGRKGKRTQGQRDTKRVYYCHVKAASHSCSVLNLLGVHLFFFSPMFCKFFEASTWQVSFACFSLQFVVWFLKYQPDGCLPKQIGSNGQSLPLQHCSRGIINLVIKIHLTRQIHLVIQRCTQMKKTNFFGEAQTRKTVYLWFSEISIQFIFNFGINIHLPLYRATLRGSKSATSSNQPWARLSCKKVSNLRFPTTRIPNSCPLIAPLRGSHGLSTRRAWRTLSSRPKGPLPRLLVLHISHFYSTLITAVHWWFIFNRNLATFIVKHLISHGCLTNNTKTN